MRGTLTRQKLYDRVWAERVDTLAKESGLPNVGFGKPAAGTTSRFRRAGTGRATSSDKGRAFRLLQALFSALEWRGHDVAADEGGQDHPNGPAPDS